jgi:regulatory protein
VTLLARRDYCSAELRARLISRGFEPEAVDASLEDLRDRRFLDDERYVRLFVASHARRGHGPIRIRHELIELGIAAEMAQGAIEAHGEWVALAQQTRARRFGTASPGAWPDKARQARFLQYRGFASDEIRSALDMDVGMDTGEDVTADSQS